MKSLSCTSKRSIEVRSQLSDLSEAQRVRLIQFKNEAGRAWKSKLIALWHLGHDDRLRGGCWLRQIRNDLGPAWLQGLDMAEHDRRIDTFAPSPHNGPIPT